MDNTHLTNENFLVFCAKVYDNPSMINSDEFLEDLNRIKYIKKLITKYIETGELKERLILNHIITLHNCFGLNLAKILFLKNEEQFVYVKPFLIFVNALPKIIKNVGTYKIIYTDNYPLDKGIVNALRKIY
jgi:hypothetical protein